MHTLFHTSPFDLFHRIEVTLPLSTKRRRHFP
nr:MAG TPA: hypothetical protein [Caudoviricetes sp.]